MNVATKIEELQKDIKELQSLRESACSNRIKKVLEAEIDKLKGELTNTETAQKEAPVFDNERFSIKLTRYAWDQTEKYVKIYVFCEDNPKLPEAKCHCMFSPRSVKLFVKQEGANDYYFTVKNLLHDIDPLGSRWNVKPTMVIIYLAKTSTEKWECVTQLEKKKSDPTKEDEETDPNDPAGGIMNLMKKMYTEGDDDMKQTIAKAWHTSQQELPYKRE